MHDPRLAPALLFFGLHLASASAATAVAPAVQAQAPAQAQAQAQARVRARDLGIPFEGQPGRWNAITDVPGVEVGHTTLVRGSGRLVVGTGPVRTGVTAILPHGKGSRVRSVAAIAPLNGNGEMTGSHWIAESGFLESPILLTNTGSVGVVRDAVIAWGNRHFQHKGELDEAFGLPVVAETYDGPLNDINGQHVRPEHAWAALDHARTGPVAEGNVGSGTGMVTSEFKGGIGTSSRIVEMEQGRYVVGVLVQANYGRREDLRILGVPVGREIPDLRPAGPNYREKDGSIIIVVATDAPLLPHQMARVARRAGLGLGRLGSVSYQSSGDLFIAFGPAEPPENRKGLQEFATLPNYAMDPLLRATVEATEEAIVNALVAAETMTGANGNTVYALPHARLVEVMRKYRVIH